jgi:phage terminase large subunit
MRDTRTIGTFSTYVGQVFKEFRKNIHVIEPFKIPHDWRKIRGLDFGFNNPTACLWIARDRDQRYYVYKEYYSSQELIETHARNIDAVYWKEDDPHFGPTYSDHDAQVRSQYASNGIVCTPANKQPAQGIELLRMLMMVRADNRPRLYIFKDCVHTIDEIFRLQYGKSTKTRNAGDLPIDKDNHTVDALYMGIFTDYQSHRESGISTGRSQRDSRRDGIHLRNSNRYVSSHGSNGNGNGHAVKVRR